MSRKADFDPYCPDCRTPSKYGGYSLKACGLTKAEHKRMRNLRKQAQEEAHKLVMQAKERTLLPEAILKEVYDQTEWDVRRLAQ
jgi:hypothetical protein